jgi:hypothetical protein
MMVTAESSQAAVYNLTSANQTQVINGILFSTSQLAVQGGTTTDFLALQSTGGTETGFNTGASVPSGNVTLSEDLQIGQQNAVALNVNPPGPGLYYVFQLDAHELNGTLSLDTLQIRTSPTAGITTFGSADFRYDLGQNSINLVDGVNGAGDAHDLYIYVPSNILFPGIIPPATMTTDYIFLNAGFSGVDGGAEVFSIVNCQPIPEPTTVFGGLFLLGGLGWIERSRLKGLLGRLLGK